MHEIRQARRIEVGRVICQQRLDELPESEIQKERATVRPRPGTHLRDLEIPILAHLSDNLVARQVLSADQSRHNMK